MSEARTPTIAGSSRAGAPPPAPTARGVERSDKSSAVVALPVLSPYRSAYYCRNCAKWVPKEEALAGPGGRPLCPRCLRPLRTKARKRTRGWEFRRVNMPTSLCGVPREGEER